MFGTLPPALSDLATPQILALFVRALLVTLGLFVALGLLAAWMLVGTDPCTLISADETCGLGVASGGLGALVLTALAAWLLFPAVALGVIAAWSDRIVAAVEARHYPEARATARRPGIMGALLLGLRSAGRLVFYNLLALPFYLLLLVTGIGPIILFVLVNGVAIGRDVGEMVAVRHGDRTERARWLKASRMERAAIGILAAGLFLLPFVNLVAPILAAAMATHLYHRTRISPIAAG